MSCPWKDNGSTSAALEKADEDEGDDDVDHKRVHVAALEGMAADKGDHDGGKNNGDDGVHEVRSLGCRGVIASTHNKDST